MKTYLNVTQADIQVTYDANGVTKNYLVAPGQRFTFDETESNGAEIEQQLVAGGAVPSN